MKRKRNPDLCYCIPSPGTKERLGHVHGARLSKEEWAKGILAIAALAGSNTDILPWLDKLPVAVRDAKRIVK